MLQFLVAKKEKEIQAVYIKIVQSKSEQPDEPGQAADRETELQLLTRAIGQFETELAGYQAQLGQEIQLYHRLGQDREELV